MERHKFLRDKLEKLNDMEPQEGCRFVTETLKYLMDSVQPERSKREDPDNLGHVFTGIPTTEESWCENCHEEDHVIKESGMRCSELYGNIERDK